MSGISENQRLLIVGTVGFILGVAVTAALFALRDDGTMPTATNENGAMEESDMKASKVPSVISSSGDRVDVDDQRAGAVVRLTSVTLSSSSWVAVHEDVGGSPGNILGAIRFDQGTSRGDLSLLRPTQPAQLYYVRLYRDNGDREFNLEDDLLLVSTANVPIEDTFRTQQ